MCSFFRKIICGSFSISVLFFFAGATCLSAKTLYVWTNSPAPAAPYGSWDAAARDIQTAVDAAIDDDIVLVTNGVYLSGNYSNEYGYSRVGVTNAITLKSVNGPDLTFIYGGETPPVRGIYISNNNASVFGFSLENGNTVPAYPARYGAGALVYDIRLISNCFFQNNINSSGEGGGVAIANAHGIISHCVMKHNEAMAGGGVAILWGGNTIMEHCLVVSNTAVNGGGMFVDNCPNVRNCLVTDNHAGSTGGGAYFGNNAQISSCTIENNTADSRGDGVCFAGDNDKLFNSSFYYNGYENLYTAPDKANHLVKYCCTTPLTDSVISKIIITNEPGYVNPSQSNYQLQPTSPCRDMGFQEPWMTETATDFDGSPRIVQDRVDIGAFEFWTNEPRIPRTFYVATNGSDQGTGLSTSDPFRTVQYGLGVLAAGDTLYIRGGTYRELLVAPAYGNASNPITICAYSNEIPIIKGSVVATGWIHHADSIWEIEDWKWNSQQLFDDGAPLQRIGYPNSAFTNGTAAFVPYGETLEDMVCGTFYNATNENTLYAWLPDGSDPNESFMELSLGRDSVFTASPYNIIRGLHFQHGNTQSIYVYGAAAVCLADSCVLDSCNVSWCDASGVQLKDNATVIGCSINNNGVTGISAFHNTNYLIRGCTFSNNNYRGFSVSCECGGIKMFNSSEGVVENNTFVDNIGYGIWFDACRYGNNVIRNNLVRGTKRNWKDGTKGYAIFYEVSPRGALIHDNLLVDNPDGSGICVAESCNVKVYNNTIVRQGGAAIISRLGQRLDPFENDAQFTNNYVFNNLIYDNQSSYVMVWPTNNPTIYVKDNYSDFNCFYRTSGTYFFKTGTNPDDVYTTLTDLIAASGFGSNSLTVNPTLMCPPAGSFQLSSQSICLNTGTTNVGAFLDWNAALDYGGNNRLVDGTPDIGCYEFSVSPSAVAPMVSITSQTGMVSFDVNSISGVNNANIAGSLWVTVSLNGSISTAGVIRSGPYNWIADTNLTETENPYTVTVFGTNELGALSSNTVEITRGGLGTGQPTTTITNENPMTAVTSSLVIGGTRNEHTTSTMSWSNYYNGECVSGGSFEGGITWTAQVSGLNRGLNTVKVYATNLWGEVTSAKIVIDYGATLHHYVVANAPNPIYPFESLETATPSIQGAVDASMHGDTVHIGAGVYNSGYRDNDGGRSRVVLDKGVTLMGIDDPHSVIIEGESSIRCMEIMHTNAALCNVTLQGGNPTQGTNINYWATYGGGALILDIRLLSNCYITGCSSLPNGVGGGVALRSVDGKITHCIIKNNQAREGGGIHAAWAANTIIENCLVTSNTATETGGGMVVDNSRSGVRNCLVTHNLATKYGGGVTFGNNAGIAHLTVSDNTALLDGNSLHFGANAAIIRNCIIADVNPLYISLPAEAHRFEYCCASIALPGNSNIIANPEFIDQEQNNYRLSYGSPCIDTGTDISQIVSDMDETVRPIDGDFDGTVRADIGCYEYDPQRTDSDGDGIVDGWEHQYGCNPTNPADATQDSDQDGMNTRGEYIAGTDPTDALDVLDIESHAYQSSDPALEFGSNLLANPDFDNGSTGWQVLGNSVTTNWNALSGPQSAILTGHWFASADYATLMQEVNITPSQTYQFNGWFYREANWTNETVVKLEFFNASYALLEVWTQNMTDMDAATWMKAYITAKAPANATRAQIVVEATGIATDAGTFYADDMAVQPVTGGDTEKVELCWMTHPGRVYRIDYANRLPCSVWLPLQTNITSATDQLHTLTDRNIHGYTNRIYRIGVTLP